LQPFTLAVFEERLYRFLDRLENTFVGGLKGYGHLSRPSHVARAKRLPQHSLTFDVSIRPERAIAFQDGSALTAVRAAVGMPPPDRQHTINSSLQAASGAHRPFLPRTQESAT
jgi:hypothetical protein